MFWRNRKEDKSDIRDYHNIEKGDHLIRWTTLYLYPVQIHGVCLSATNDRIVLVDFGLAANKHTCDQQIEGLFDRSLQDLLDHEDQALMAAAEKHKNDKVGPERISILTLTEPEEIRQWKKINYGEEVTKENKWWTWKRKEKNTTFIDETASSEDTQEASAVVPKLPKSDPTNIVLARLRYLLTNPRTLPPHHLLFSNSECIAVWVKTGRFSTLQASIFLHTVAAGNFKNTATIAATLAATTTTTTVPAWGVLGWVGLTKTVQVSLLSAMPWLIPVIAGYGLLSVGTPMIILKKAKEEWQETTATLTDGFWAWADTDIFVEAIKSWSALQ